MRYRATYCNDKDFTAEFEANSTEAAVKRAVEMYPEHWLSNLQTVHDLSRMLYMVYFEKLHDDGDRTAMYEGVWAWSPADAARRLIHRMDGQAEVIEIFHATNTNWSK